MNYTVPVIQTLSQGYGAIVIYNTGAKRNVLNKDAVQYVARVLFRIVLNKTLVGEFEILL